MARWRTLNRRRRRALTRNEQARREVERLFKDPATLNRLVESVCQAIFTEFKRSLETFADNFRRHLVAYMEANGYIEPAPTDWPSILLDEDEWQDELDVS